MLYTNWWWFIYKHSWELAIEEFEVTQKYLVLDFKLYAIEVKKNKTKSLCYTIAARTPFC